MERVKINDLSPGMIVDEPVYMKNSDKVLLNYGTKLTKSIIDLLKSRDIKDVAVSERFTLFVEPEDAVEGELQYLLNTRISKNAPDKIEANTSDNMVEVAKKSHYIAEKIVEDKNIVNICVQMKLVNNEYIYKHGINTCALSLLIAGALGLTETQMYQVGVGALLHDLGMCEMAHLVDKKDLSEHEESLLKEHPTYGYYSAKEKGIQNEIADIILYHHERWNGSGYPQAIKGYQIPFGARIVAVCETYDKLLRFEHYPNYQAIEYLYGTGNFYFDMNVVNSFTGSLAVYPLGSIVMLSTGEVGVVVNVRKNHGPRPIVKVYYNRVNRPYSCPREVDLGQERTVFIEKIL